MYNPPTSVRRMSRSAPSSMASRAARLSLSQKATFGGALSCSHRRHTPIKNCHASRAARLSLSQKARGAVGLARWGHQKWKTT